jgi:hypothetical protein
MRVFRQEPNWDLVTECYKEPKSFADLLHLLTPQPPHGTEKQQMLFAWKEKEFYKKENIIPFIRYGIEKISELPKFHKDELPVLLRIVRLYQEIGAYKEAYEFMEEQKLIQFIFTAIDQNSWDTLTKVVGWNYLIVKQKTSQICDWDHIVWNKVKFNQEWTKEYSMLLSHKELLDFTLLYLCKQAKHITMEELEEDMMQLAMYCNTFISEIYTYKLIKRYERCVNFLEHYHPNSAVIACQRAVMAQLNDFFSPFEDISANDFLYEMKVIIEHMDEDFSCKYNTFIGKLLSYIPFYEMIQVPKQIRYFEDIMHASKEIDYKEIMLRTYVFSQLTNCFITFVKPFIQNKCYNVIHELLFYWCTQEDREQLERYYHLEKLYELYACG